MKKLAPRRRPRGGVPCGRGPPRNAAEPPPRRPPWPPQHAPTPHAPTTATAPTRSRPRNKPTGSRPHGPPQRQPPRPPPRRPKNRAGPGKRQRAPTKPPALPKSAHRPRLPRTRTHIRQGGGRVRRTARPESTPRPPGAAQDGEWFTFEANVNLSIPGGPLASEWFTFAANVNLSTPSPMVHSGGKREPCGPGCLGPPLLGLGLRR